MHSKIIGKPVLECRKSPTSSSGFNCINPRTFISHSKKTDTVKSLFVHSLQVDSPCDFQPKNDNKLKVVDSLISNGIVNETTSLVHSNSTGITQCVHKSPVKTSIDMHLKTDSSEVLNVINNDSSVVPMDFNPSKTLLLKTNSPEENVDTSLHHPHNDPGLDNNSSEYSSQDSLTSQEKSSDKQSDDDCSDKVIVQVLPTAEYSGITALDKCNDKSIQGMSPKEKSSSILNFNSWRNLREELESFKSSRKVQILAGFNKLNHKQSYSTHRSIRKNHSLNFHIRPGKGDKLHSIGRIKRSVDTFSDAALRFLHYVLFGSNRTTSTDSALEGTRANILHFSGFTFEKDSEMYQKKSSFLLRAPYAILLEIYENVIGGQSREKCGMAKELLAFFLCPKEFLLADDELNECQTIIITNEETEKLKDSILNGPKPSVIIEKLDFSNLNEFKTCESISEQDLSIVKEKGIEPSSFESLISEGPGVKLKSLPQVVDNVQKAKRKLINLLHTIMFGRPGSEEQNRLNILEFNGFSSRQRGFAMRKHNFLVRLGNKDLVKLCDVFSLQKSGSKIRKIKKLLQFLTCPCLVLRQRKKRTSVQSKENETLVASISNRNRPKVNAKNTLKLSDFDRIRFNVECAPPAELSELNDLLFVRPCDSSEIHQKILNFGGFVFEEDSVELHYRKSLLHYMSFNIIKKMARLLDIPNSEFSNHHDLAIEILKFLMELKSSANYKNSAHLKSSILSNEQRPNIQMIGKEQNGLSTHEEENNSHHTRSYNGINGSCNGCEDGCSNCKSSSNSRIIIKRISDSSYSWTDLNDNKPLTISDMKSDEAISLEDFKHHPTVSELEVQIRDAVQNNQWSITVGDVINKVLQNYPTLNLTYRVEFIKAKILDVLHELQTITIDTT